MSQDNVKYYIHSKCCDVHWELVMLESGEYTLQCENCGKDWGYGTFIMSDEPQVCQECIDESCKKLLGEAGK